MRKPMEDRKIVVIWEFILHFPNVVQPMTNRESILEGNTPSVTV